VFKTVWRSGISFILHPETAEGELRYISTLVAKSNAHMAVLASETAELTVLKAAARKNRARRSRMHCGSSRWQKRVKNVNRSRFISPKASQEVRGVAAGVWLATKCKKRQGPTEARVRSLLMQLVTLSYGGSFYNGDLFKMFQKTSSLSATRLACTSGVCTNGCSLSELREIRKQCRSALLSLSKITRVHYAICFCHCCKGGGW
jgi:hypothetical protein